MGGRGGRTWWLCVVVQQTQALRTAPRRSTSAPSAPSSSSSAMNLTKTPAIMITDAMPAFLSAVLWNALMPATAGVPSSLPVKLASDGSIARSSRRSIRRRVAPVDLASIPMYSFSRYARALRMCGAKSASKTDPSAAAMSSAPTIGRATRSTCSARR